MTAVSLYGDDMERVCTVLQRSQVVGEYITHSTSQCGLKGTHRETLFSSSYCRKCGGPHAPHSQGPLALCESILRLYLASSVHMRMPMFSCPELPSNPHHYLSFLAILLIFSILYFLLILSFLSFLAVLQSLSTLQFLSFLATLQILSFLIFMRFLHILQLLSILHFLPSLRFLNILQILSICILDILQILPFLDILQILSFLHFLPCFKIGSCLGVSRKRHRSDTKSNDRYRKA